MAEGIAGTWIVKRFLASPTPDNNGVLVASGEGTNVDTVQFFNEIYSELFERVASDMEASPHEHGGEDGYTCSVRYRYMTIREGESSWRIGNTIDICHISNSPLRPMPAWEYELLNW